MNWKQLLNDEIESAYAVTEKLIGRVDPTRLAWKPATGSNWMTTAQLLKHIASSCGSGCRATLSGDWGLPEGKTYQDLSPAEALPPAECLPAVQSVDEAKALLAEDRSLALQALEQCTEGDLADKCMPLAWDPSTVLPLGRHLLLMIDHLKCHKSQLFYYLKLQGQPVSTVDLWG